jgi:esterase/lipase
MNLNDTKLKYLIDRDLLNRENVFYSKGDSKVGVLLLHGLGFDMNNLELLFKYLKLKKYTIRMPLIGGLSGFKGDRSSSSKEWLKEVEDHFEKLSSEVNSVVIIGHSFGGNLGLSLAASNTKKIKAIITLETPIFFKIKIKIFLALLQPLLEFFKVDLVRKNRFVYRSNYVDTKDVFPFLHVKMIGGIYKFIKFNSTNNLKKIKAPYLIIQAKTSDLISSRSAKYIFEKIKSNQKEIYYVDSNNHDFDLMDEEGKILILEKINKFIKYI